MKKRKKQIYPELYFFTNSNLLYIVHPDKQIERCDWWGIWKKGSTYTNKQIRYGKDFKFIGEIR